jgi:hypothetical protein
LPLSSFNPLGFAGIGTTAVILPVAGLHRASPSATLDKRMNYQLFSY